MFKKLRDKKVRYSRYSKIMKKHIHENRLSFFEEYFSTDILRFEKNKRKRDQSMLFREQTHIYRRSKLFILTNNFSHPTDQIK